MKSVGAEGRRPDRDVKQSGSYGARCRGCGAIWSAFTPPVLLDQAVRLMQASSRCQTCGGRDVVLMMPDAFAEAIAARGTEARGAVVPQAPTGITNKRRGRPQA